MEQRLTRGDKGYSEGVEVAGLDMDLSLLCGEFQCLVRHWSGVGESLVSLQRWRTYCVPPLLARCLA